MLAEQKDFAQHLASIRFVLWEVLGQEGPIQIVKLGGVDYFST